MTDQAPPAMAQQLASFVAYMNGNQEGWRAVLVMANADGDCWSIASAVPADEIRGMLYRAASGLPKVATGEHAYKAAARAREQNA